MNATRSIIGEELRRERHRVAVVLVFVVLAGAATAVGPLLLRAAIDNGIDAGDRAALRTTAIAYLVVSIGAGIAGGIRTATMAVAAERILHRLRLRALAGVLRMDLGAYERAPRGDVVARVTSDTEALSKAAIQVLPNAAKYTLDLFAAILAVFLLSPVIGALSLIVVPPFAIAGRWFRRTSVVVYPEYRRRVGEMVGTVVETTEGAETVRAFGREAHQLTALARADERVVDGYLAGMRMRVRFFASLTFVQAVATAIVLIASSLLALNGTLSVGTVAAGVLAAVQVFVPFGEMTELLDELLASKAALDRVAEVASIPAEAEGGAALPGRGSLELEHTGFAYVENRPVLHDISLRVEPGEWLALVGATGAGKSTIARLAVGLAASEYGHGARSRASTCVKRYRPTGAAVCSCSRRKASSYRGASPTTRASPIPTTPTWWCTKRSTRSVSTTGSPASHAASTHRSAAPACGCRRVSASSSLCYGWCSPTPPSSCSTRRPVCSTPRARRASPPRSSARSPAARCLSSRTGW